MKKLFLSLGIASMLGMASCSEDFEVAAPYKDVTVVYGVWDKEDTAHYVRIQKAFLDESKSAVDMSKVADSSYYKDLTVVVREINGGRIISTNPLSKVNLITEGYMKEPAANEQGFFTSPHNGYKLKQTLNPGYSYRLVITNNATGNVDSSEIAIVGKPETNSFPTANWEIQFAKVTGKFLLNVIATPNARFYEATMRINYVDIDANNSNKETAKYAELPLDRVVVSTGNTARIEVLHSNVYNMLVSKLGTPPSNIRRRLDSCDFFFYAGSNELYQYDQLASGQGGITNDQIRPNFTNIRGKSAIGLFASKSSSGLEYTGYKIGNLTIDSLIKSPQTQSLGIIKP